MRLTAAIDNLKHEIEKENINPANGIGEELFLLVASLTPIVNVDLLIVQNGKVLMAWRDDDQCGQGWHIPGGCVRISETMEKRIHECARLELGSDVTCSMMPVKITESIRHKVKYGRMHFISFLYNCTLLDEERLVNLDGKEIEGHLGWFSCIPNNFLGIQEFYRECINEYLIRKEG